MDISRAARDSWASREPLPSRKITWRRAAGQAFFAGLGRPWLWPWSLLAFLLRGGIVLFLLPIVVVPSTVGVATFIGPMAVTVAGPTEYFVGLIAFAFGALGAWLVVGGFVAAWAERGLISEALSGDRPDPSETAVVTTPGSTYAPSSSVGSSGSSLAAGARGIGGLARILLVRLVALLPLAVVLAWAAARIGTVGYEELTVPGEVATALPLRVLARVGDVLAIAAAAWLVCETVGGIAVRRMLLRGDSVPGALVFAVVDVVRRPVTSILSAVVPLLGAALLVGPSLAAAWIVWGRLKFALESGLVVAEIVLTMLFVAIWALGLVLAAAAAAWRGTAWTFELLRTGSEPGPGVEPEAAPLEAGLVSVSAK